MEVITLQDVLRFLDSGEKCDLMAITCNERLKTGGEEIWYKGVRKLSSLCSDQEASINRAQPKTEIIRNPNHFENSTRNLLLQNGDIREIHIRLIRVFNGKRVL